MPMIDGPLGQYFMPTSEVKARVASIRRLYGPSATGEAVKAAATNLPRMKAYHEALAAQARDELAYADHLEGYL